MIYRVSEPNIVYLCNPFKHSGGDGAIQNGIPIRLPDERWIHLTEGHSEMAEAGSSYPLEHSSSRTLTNSIDIINDWVSFYDL